MKTRYLLAGMAFALLQVLAISCSKDDDTPETPQAPSIEGVELGLENSKEAYTENDIHVEAMVKSVAGLKSVSVQITPQIDGLGWAVNETYSSEYVVNKNEYELHRHYDIPKTAKEGYYDVVIIAVDVLGQKTLFKDVIKVIKDPSLPQVIARTSSYADNILKIQAQISAPQKLASIKIQVKDIVKTLGDEELKEQTSYTLKEEIDVTSLPKGHYHFFVTIVDKAGKKYSYEDHFNK